MMTTTKMTRAPVSLTWVGVALPPLSLSFRNISLLCCSLCWRAELLAAGCSILSMLARVISTNSTHHNTGLWNNACSWPTVGYSAFGDFRLLRLQTVEPRRRLESRRLLLAASRLYPGMCSAQRPCRHDHTSGRVDWESNKGKLKPHYREDPPYFVMVLLSKLWKPCMILVLLVFLAKLQSSYPSYNCQLQIINRVWATLQKTLITTMTSTLAWTKNTKLGVDGSLA